MNHHKISSICFIVVCAALAGFTQSGGAFICLSVSIVLFGFVLWLEKETSVNFKAINDRIKELDAQIQDVKLKRAIGGR